MSKYVKHKHGLVVGSDNVFFVVKEDGDDQAEGFRDGYRAIVSTDSYHFENSNTLNVRVRTPAQQIVWRVTGGEDCRTIMLAPYWWTWLKKNVGDYREAWDVRTVIGTRGSETIFFKRRTDALCFVRAVTQQLEGMRIGL